MNRYGMIKLFEELDATTQLRAWNDYVWVNKELSWVWDTIDTAIGFWSWDIESWNKNDSSYALHVAELVQSSKNYRHDDDFVRLIKTNNGFCLMSSNYVTELIPKDENHVPLYKKQEFVEFFNNWCISKLNGEPDMSGRKID